MSQSDLNVAITRVVDGRLPSSSGKAELATGAKEVAKSLVNF